MDGGQECGSQTLSSTYVFKMIEVLLDGVLPIFAIVVIGYALGKRGIFDKNSAAVINKFVFLVAIPALGLHLIANAPFSLFDWRMIIGFFLSELAIYALGAFTAHFLFKCELKESILLGLAASFGNHILYVLPIAISLFGEDATLAFVAIIAVDSILIFGSTIVIIELMTAKNSLWADISKKIFLNPPLISMLLGIFLVIFNVKIPNGFNIFLNFVGDVAAPSALFSLGIILSQISGLGRIGPALSISTFKLIVHPLFALIILVSISGLTLTQAKIPMIAAAAPCGTMAFVLALHYGVRTDAIVPAILLTTIGSVLSVTLAASI